MSSKAIGKGFAVLAAAAFIAALMLPSKAGAIEVKKSLYTSTGGGGGGGGGGSGAPAAANPMSKAQMQELQDAVASDSEQYVDQESEKKSSGEAYIDLEHAKPHIFPSGSAVTVKLEADGYKAKGRKSGERKSLVFKYKQEGSKYVLDGDPKWEDVASKGK
jgi:hypothetical protein